MSIETRERGDPLCIRLDDVCHRSVTLGEFLVDTTWRFLIDGLTLEEFENELNKITDETPGALEKNAGWDELEAYLFILWHNDNCKSYINRGTCNCLRKINNVVS